MERQVQHKHFIEHFYLTSGSVKQTFLGHLLCMRHHVPGEFSRMRCQHLQTWRSWASGFPVAKEKQWPFFIYSSWSFLIWSMKTNMRVEGFSQKHSMLSRASEISSTEKENWKFWRRGVCRGNPKHCPVWRRWEWGEGMGRWASPPHSLTSAIHSSF